MDSMDINERCQVDIRYYALISSGIMDLVCLFEILVIMRKWFIDFVLFF